MSESDLVLVTRDAGLARVTLNRPEALNALSAALRARLVEVLFGHHWHPATLNLVATAVLPLAFAATLPAPLGIAGGLAFAVLYGAGNGLVTITRGSLPLVLFDTRVYGQLVGRLLAPGFLVAAAAPMAFAWCEAALGARATAFLAMLLAASMTMASAALWRLSRNHA